MRKLINDIIREPKWFLDKVTHKSKISAADHSYLTSDKNGKGVQLFGKLLYLLGNRYSGSKLIFKHTYIL